jgi:hypothetical protein
MATLTIQKLTNAGLDPSSYLGAPAAGGDKFKNDGRTYLHAKSGGTAITITVEAVPDITVALTTSDEKLIGPFTPVTYNDVDGYVNLAYNAVTSLTVAAVQLRE